MSCEEGRVISMKVVEQSRKYLRDFLKAIKVVNRVLGKCIALIEMKKRWWKPLRFKGRENKGIR